MHEATLAWVEKALAAGERIVGVQRLRGGWTSRMRRLEVDGPGGRRALVLRSFTDPFFLKHAKGLLTREAEVLRLLKGTQVPAAELIAVDAEGEHCDYPSLLMSLLPGTVRHDDEATIPLLARQLAEIHRVEVTARRARATTRRGRRRTGSGCPRRRSNPRCGARQST